MKIATFNVNSIRRRIGGLIAWLNEAQPDVVLLQELKCQDEQFPALDLSGAGYQSAMVGQKAYNGVAVLSKHKIDVVMRALPGEDADDHARYIEADIDNGKEKLRVASIYLPNGNPIDTPKFPYKLRFLDRLRARAQELLALDRAVVLGGDYNVAPTDEDVFDIRKVAGDALVQPQTRLAWRAIVNLGYTDAFRALHGEPHQYTFWDYQAGAWPRDNGWRIDHLLLSPQAADRLEQCVIDRDVRGRPEASDHTPIWCSLKA